MGDGSNNRDSWLQTRGCFLRKLFLGESRWHTFLAALLLAIVTIALYYQVRTHPFLEGDDYFYVVTNPNIHGGLTWTTFRWAFTTLKMVNWIPLIWLSHSLNYQLFGLNPLGHHIVNVLFHALNVALLFWVMKRATGYAGRSFVMAALFALHPINVESVVWIAELKTMVSTTFLLLTLAAYRWCAQAPRPGRYSVVVLMFALALMSKPQVIMLPFLLLLWDYWPLQRMLPLGRKKLGEKECATLYPRKSIVWLVGAKLPLFALSAADALLTLKVQGASPRYWSTAYSLGARVENAIVCYVRYIGKAFWPASLALDYPHPNGLLPAWQVGGALTVLLLITGLVLLGWRRRYLTVGWFWFLLSLLPMIGVVQVGVQAMADRYAYDSFWGLFIMVCWGVPDWANAWHVSTAWLGYASAVVLLAFSIATWRQIGYWKDTYGLWAHASQVVKNHWKAEDGMGDVLRVHGDQAGAMQHYYTAYAMNSGDAWSNQEIGFFEQTLGNPQSAILHYQRALHAKNLQSQYEPLLWRNMGVAYRDLGDMAKARECLEKAASLKPQ